MPVQSSQIRPILCLLALLLTGNVRASVTANPNIVFIYGDDIGYGDLGCYGATAVRTPHVDRLAAEGLRFTSAYSAAATCTPSRYALLTGEYAFREKGTDILPGDAALIIEPGRATLPSLLRQAGYRTGVVGKWHLGLGSGKAGPDWNGEIRPGPLEVGFDDSFIMAATGDRVPCVFVQNHHVVGKLEGDPIFVNYKEAYPGEPTGKTNRGALTMDWSHEHNQAVVNGISRIGFMKGGKAALWKDEEMADTFTGEALSFIEREKGHPFFLYFAPHDIHVPRVPNSRFKGRTPMGPRGDAIAEFDDAVGAVLKKLDELGLSDNTLVILSSDNGPVLDDGYRDGANEKLGEHKPAGPFRGGKYSQFEGGTRMPLIIRYPGKVKPGVSETIVSQVDFAASLGRLVGQHPAATMRDSQNVLPALLGQSATGRQSVIEQAQGLSFRKGNWKYIAPGKAVDQLGPWKKVQIPAPGWLFDLSKDPGETKNLSAKYPEKLKELAAELSKISGL